MTAAGASVGRPRRSDETGARLRQEIERGRFHGAEVLPGERQLAALLRVSRTTLRRALSDLIADGLLVQRHGMGTFVAHRAPKTELKPHDGPVVYFNLNGRIDRAAEFARGASDPTMDEAMTFGISPREAVFRLSRIIVAKGRPDAVEHAAAPVCLLPAPTEIGSDLAAAIGARGFRPVRSVQRLRVAQLEEADAGYLGVAPGAPAISVHEAMFLAEGRCCVFTRAFYLADRFDAVFATPLADDGGDRSRNAAPT